MKSSLADNGFNCRLHNSNKDNAICINFTRSVE
uniref:Uncharacterized protein n=1 Tax=Tetranychus urticae TaxID=32264 RepID=T1KR74_TETUR